LNAEIITKLNPLCTSKSQIIITAIFESEHARAIPGDTSNACNHATSNLAKRTILHQMVDMKRGSNACCRRQPGSSLFINTTSSQSKLRCQTHDCCGIITPRGRNCGARWKCHLASTMYQHAYGTTTTIHRICEMRCNYGRG